MGIDKFLQVYVAWCNNLIFENQQMSIQKILPRILGFFHDYLKQKEVQSTTHTTSPLAFSADISGFFDGAQQNGSCGGGATFISPEKS